MVSKLQCPNGSRGSLKPLADIHVENLEPSLLLGVVEERSCRLPELDRRILPKILRIPPRVFGGDFSTTKLGAEPLWLPLIF